MNKHLLYYQMKMKNVSVDDLCKQVGFSRSAFYRKVSGKRQFTLDEIKKIVDVLHLSSPMDIFFAEEVS